MSDILNIILLTTAAGACIPLGGLLARIEHIQPQWLEQEFRHVVIAFGGGILLGAVAFVLVPEGNADMGDSPWGILIILGGGFCFFGVERWMGRQKLETPQLLGMLLDYVPEAIALGGLAASGSPIAGLLALLIGLQNLPEGFNAFRELKAKNHSARKSILVMCALVPLGPLAGLAGYFVLSSQAGALGAIMLFASGGVLYLIFQDIAPQSRLTRHWLPPLGAVFGFCFALLSEMLVSH